MSIITPESCIPTREKSLRDEENALFVARIAKLRKARENAHDNREHDATPDMKCHVCSAIAKEAWERKRGSLKQTADDILRAAGYSISRGRWASSR